MMTITRRSPISLKNNSMDLKITDEQLRRWKNGELIQNVFPHLTPNEREFLLTGIMPDEWDELFNNDK